MKSLITWLKSLFTKSESATMTETTTDATVEAAAAAANAVSDSTSTASEVASVAAAAAVAAVAESSSTGAAVVAAVGPELTDALRKILVALGHDVTSVWDEAVALATAATKAA